MIAKKIVTFISIAAIFSFAATSGYAVSNIEPSSINKARTSSKIYTSKDSALMRAVTKGDLKTVQNLIRSGANVNIISDTGFTALDFAILAENPQMVNLLMKAGGKTNKYKKSDADKVIKTVKSGSFFTSPLGIGLGVAVITGAVAAAAGGGGGGGGDNNNDDIIYSDIPTAENNGAFEELTGNDVVAPNLPIIIPADPTFGNRVSRTINGETTTTAYKSFALDASGNGIGCSTNGSFTSTQEYTNQWGLGVIKASAAYARGCTGKGVTVAVLDSGFDLDHPELAASYLRNATTNEIIGYDAAFNAGYNTGANSSNSPAYILGQYNYVHGTITAGYIAAQKDGGIFTNNIHGVAYDAKILPVKIATDSADGTKLVGMANGINYIANNQTELGVRVINNSWTANIRNYRKAGWPVEDPNNLLPAFKNAASHGIINVFSAGNAYPYYTTVNGIRTYVEGNHMVTDTANAPNFAPELKGYWLAAAALENPAKNGGNYKISASYCGTAKDWCLAAPESGISTVPDNSYSSYYKGSSTAAPYVSGAVAILLQEFPYLTSPEIVQILLTSATKTQPNGTLLDPEIFGQGILNLEAATNPMGTVTVATGASTSGVATTLSSTSISGGILGTAVMSSLSDSSYSGDLQFAILDGFKRSYLIDGADFVSADKTNNFANLWNDFYQDQTSQAKVSLGKNTSLNFAYLNSQNSSAKFSANNAAEEVLGNFQSISFATTDSNQKSAFSFNYNMPMEKSFHLGVLKDSDNVLVDEHLVQSAAFGNPFVNFASEGINSVAKFNSEDGLESFKVAAFYSKFARSYIDEQGNSGYLPEERPIQGFVADYNKKVSKNVAFGLQFGQITEEKTVLGTTNGGAFALGENNKTLFSGISSRINLGNKASLYGNFNYGISTPNTVQNSLIKDVSDIKTSSFGVGVVKDEMFKRNDKIGFAISQPLRIESGSANLNLPMGRTNDGQIIQRNVALDLAPSGREIDYEVFYKMDLANDFNLKTKFMYRTNANHDRNSAPEGVLFFRFGKVF